MQKQTATKRLLATSLALILAFGFLMPVTAFANDSIRVEIDGRQVTFTPAPMSVNGRTMLPLRTITESLGMTVAHDPTNNTVIMVLGSTNIIHQISTASISVNGVVSQFDAPSMVVDGSIFVPVRMLAEAIGASVEWDGARNTVVINTRGETSQNGNATLQPPVTTISDQEAVEIRVNTISTFGGSSYAISDGGFLYAWGNNSSGQLGDETTTNRLRPVRVMENVISVSGDYVIRSDNTLWRLGTTNERIMDNVIAVSRGDFHTLAVQADGSLWAWGDNLMGQIGDGTHSEYYWHADGSVEVLMDNNRRDPVRIMDNVISVSAGNEHSLALRNDGTVWAWGNNWNGQIGDGTLTPRDNFGGALYVPGGRRVVAPVQVFDNAREIYAGRASSFAIRNDNTLWAWGINEHGRLGIEMIPTEQSTREVATPTRIMENITAIANNDATTLAIRPDGSLIVWGIGAVLDGSYTHIPEVIFSNARDVTIGGAGQILILRNDGSLWGMGQNWTGGIGDGTTQDRVTPVHIMDNIRMP